MRVLVFSTSSNDTDKLITSLKCQPEHDVHVFRYDSKWHAHVDGLRALAANRHDPAKAAEGQRALQELNQGVYKFPAEVDATPDVEMIQEIAKVRPDIAIYIWAFEGAFVPLNATLAAINLKVPLVCMYCDAGDPPAWPQMVGFDRDRCFSLSWNIDGVHNWPGGKDWKVDEGHVAWGALPAAGYQGPTPRRFYPNPIPQGWNIKGLTTLTPVDPSFFDGPKIDFRDRPFRIGYAGNWGGWMRKAVLEFMQKKYEGIFAPYQRDDNANSYPNYCEYLRYCQCVINVPFSGSNAAKQVKGRIVEAGWAGCSVLEWKGAATEKWFRPGVDFEGYAGIADLEATVESILDAQPDVEEMARALQTRVREEHTPQIIWNQVFRAVGL